MVGAADEGKAQSVEVGVDCLNGKQRTGRGPQGKLSRVLVLMSAHKWRSRQMLTWAHII